MPTVARATDGTDRAPAAVRAEIFASTRAWPSCNAGAVSVTEFSTDYRRLLPEAERGKTIAPLSDQTQLVKRRPVNREAID